MTFSASWTVGGEGENEEAPVPGRSETNVSLPLFDVKRAGLRPDLPDDGRYGFVMWNVASPLASENLRRTVHVPAVPAAVVNVPFSASER